MFQSTHLREVRQDESTHIIHQAVSIHAPTRGATQKRAIAAQKQEFQSTHLREVRHRVLCASTPQSVSIHAPTRGATILFTYAPYVIHVSIHAPTRGATSSVSSSAPTCTCFNPRTYERCDKVSKNTFDWSHAFQSTHLREVRPKGIDQATLSRSFNPRTYERCDIKLLFTFVSVQFQSTHLREVRPQDNPVCQSIDKFQSTHLREVRHMRYVDLLDENGFNPRTYERCDKAWPSTGASS